MEGPILTILLIEALEIFCLYYILIKNDYKYNKLFKVLILLQMIPSPMLSLKTSMIIGLLSNVAVVTYFYNYKRNYHGLYDESIIVKEDKKKGYASSIDFIKDWILYIIVFEAGCLAYLEIFYGDLGLSMIAPITFIVASIIAIINPILKQKYDDKMQACIQKNIKEKEKNEAEQKYINDSKTIYSYYKQNGYDINDDETNEIISSTKNITVEKLKELYSNGEILVLKEKQLKEAKLLQSERTQEEEKINLAKEKIKLVGKNKYLSILDDRIEAFDAMKKLANIMSDSYISGAVNASKPKKTDPFIFGGMAEGIAGPAAGLMVASKIERENQEREAKSKEVAKASMEAAGEWRNKAHTYSGPLSKFRKLRDKFDAALIVNDIEKAKSKITISNIEYKILKTKNFLVEFILKTENIRLLDKDALIDGSIKVNIFDKDNNLIAEGYHSAKNISINDNQEIDVSYGFREFNCPRVYCKTLDYSKIQENSKYKVEIEFLNLWIVEDLEKTEESEERSRENRLANAKLERFYTLDDTITTKTRLNAILKFISEQYKETLKCYAPLEKGGIIFTDGYMVFRLKCNYLPCDVGFTTNYDKKAKYLENYKPHIGKVINSNYPDLSQFLQKYDKSDEIIFNLKEIKEKNKLKEEHITFKTSGNYEVTLSIKFILTMTKILNIKEETFRGYAIDRLKPVQIFNEEGEMAVILPINK